MEEFILLYSVLGAGVLILIINVFTILKQQVSRPRRGLQDHIAKLAEEIRALD